MSHFMRRTRNPETGLFEDAVWIDDYFGHHRYGVQFPGSERVWRVAEHPWEFDDQPAPCAQPCASASPR
jgi:hypothetical protein